MTNDDLSLISPALYFYFFLYLFFFFDNVISIKNKNKNGLLCIQITHLWTMYTLCLSWKIKALSLSWQKWVIYLSFISLEFHFSLARGICALTLSLYFSLSLESILVRKHISSTTILFDQSGCFFKIIIIIVFPLLL